MTADNNSNPESDNSDSRTTEPHDKLRSALPLIAFLRDYGGWACKADLHDLIGPSGSEVDEYVDLLERTGELKIADLGETTLVVLRDIDVDVAIAQLSDREERQWRKETDDQFPRVDERAPDDRRDDR